MCIREVLDSKDRSANPLSMITAVIQVPYDSGQRERRRGLGPGALLRQGVIERAANGGGAVPARVDTDEAFPAEIAVSFDLARKLSGEVARARRQEAFPLVLSGDALPLVGALAGLAEVPRPGLVWVSRRSGMERPKTTESGCLDDMTLATAGGLCWQGMTAALPGFGPLPDEAMLRLDAGGGDGAALDSFARAVDAAYLHIDAATLDQETLSRLPGIVASVVRTVPVAAAGLSGYDPESDGEGARGEALLSVIETIVSEASRRLG